jgi:hypothetical protein
MQIAHSALVVLSGAAEETAQHHNELPMSPEAFGLVTLGTFAFLLLVTWAFKSVGTRH